LPANVHSAASLRVNVAWGTLGGATYALAQWLIVVVIARVGTPADLGRFSLALALVAPPALLFGLNLRTLVATDASQAHALDDIFRLRIWASALYLALVAVLVGFVSSVAALAVALALWKTVDSFSDICYGAYQRAERMDRIGSSQCVKAAAMVGAFSLGFAATGDLLIATAMLVAASISVLYALDLPSLRGEPSIDTRPWSALVLAALPAGGVVFLDSLVLNVPRYLLHAQHGAAELGFFSSAAYFMVAGGTLAGAIGCSVTPRLARLYLSDRAGFRWLLFRALRWSLAVGAIGIVLAAAFGEPLLGLVYGPAYAAYAATLVIVMLAAALWYGAGIACSAINAARRFHLHLWIMAASLAVLAVAAWLLVPPLGAPGAAWALCVSMAVRFVLSLATVVRLC
jgi:O-antigen/teichoic acid export membrane protein